MSTLGPLQQALYSKLTADTALKALLAEGADSILDHVSETAEFPYVTIGDATEIPENLLAEKGWESTETLHIWVRERGYKTGNSIAGRIFDLLDHQSLTVAGRAFVSCKYEYGEALRDPDPEIRHHVIRFRICTDQPA